MAESGQRGSRRDNFPNDGVALRHLQSTRQPQRPHAVLHSLFLQ